MGKNPIAERTQRTGENAMAVRTQQTGANSRVEVARSHMPASIGARRCTRSVRLNQNSKRSSSANIFSGSKRHTEQKARPGAVLAVHRA